MRFTRSNSVKMVSIWLMPSLASLRTLRGSLARVGFLQRSDFGKQVLKRQMGIEHGCDRPRILSVPSRGHGFPLTAFSPYRNHRELIWMHEFLGPTRADLNQVPVYREQHASLRAKMLWKHEANQLLRRASGATTDAHCISHYPNMNTAIPRADMLEAG